MAKETIGQQIEDEISFCKESEIENNPSFAPTHPELLDYINSYLHSKFREGENDSEGFKRWFFNVSDFRAKVVSKSVDLDTKDINIIPEDGQPYIVPWFLTKELKLWMKEQIYGKFLNECKDELPRWGGILAKKVRDEVDLVDLRNFYSDPFVKTLAKSSFKIEEHIFNTPDELEEAGEKYGWKNIGEAIDILKKSDDDLIVHERYGMWENQLARHFVIYRDKKEAILAEDAINEDETPYKELHMDKRLGRWLGRGTIEDLFENQIAQNQTVNFKRKAMHWNSKIIFQSKDSTVASNLLSDLLNGQIVNTPNGPIDQIKIDERNLANYKEEIDRWEHNADQKQFTHDPIQGGEPEHKATLGQVRIQTAMAGSYFQAIREDFAFFLKDILFDWILPDFKKQKHQEHYLNFLGEPAEVDKFDKLVVHTRARESLIDFLKRKGTLPSRDHYELIKAIEGEKIKSNRSIKMLKGFYDNLKYKIDIVIVGESIDLGSKINTLHQALGLVATNPTLLINPQTRKVFYKILSYAGISPEEFEAETDMDNLMALVARQGGQRRPPQIPVGPGPERMPQEQRV